MLKPALASGNLGEARRRGWSLMREHPLATGLVFSAVVHLLALAVHFVAPDSFRLHSADSPLEVVLVNAKSANAPDKATALAQANLVGGGEHDGERATSPLPSRAFERDGAPVAQIQRNVSDLEAMQEKLLSQLRSQYAAAPESQRNRADAPQRGQGHDDQNVDQRIARLQAEIDKQLRAYQTRPKRGQVTANTREVVYARYFDTLRHRVERYGTEHFPQIGNDRLYGELIVTLNVNQRGGLGYHKDGWSVTGVEVTRSSGNRDLDRRAVAIVQASAPFGDFSSEMKQRYDILEIVTRMTFSRQGVQAETLAAPPEGEAR
ncbi:periplasmic protein TonB [Pandoraea horticolens]|uniref:Periplasmic protein TonB n=1 Tax=Pandoraea horticolens TaxID=2508298 RepID=A0A5E4U271_9BURK|nr:energy transducer TonB [Pandoraea horticolens]VVD94207.1 periplasmic protein TonB [Pandoraea horticolens]